MLQRDRDPGRPHRQADAGRQARAGLRRRHDGHRTRPCTTCSRCAARACRIGDDGDRAARRRRHPGGGRRVRERGAISATCPNFRMPRGLPGLRQPRRAREGRRRPPLQRRPVLRRAAQAARSCTSPAGARSTSKAWATSSSTSSSTAAWSSRCPDLYALDARTSVEALERMADKSAGQPRSPNIAASRDDDAGALSLRRSASATSARRRPRTWRATSAASTGCATPTWRSCSRCPTSGRSSPRASTTSSPRRTTSRSSMRLRAAGFEWSESEGEADRVAEAARRQDLRPHRHAADARRAKTPRR